MAQPKQRQGRKRRQASNGTNGVNGARGRDGASTMPPQGGMPPRAAGRRARQRAAQEQAARRRRIVIIAAIITVVIVAAILIGTFVLFKPSGQNAALVNPSAYNVNAKELSLGSKAPNFDSATINGQHYTLAAQHGHPVLVELFAVWCPHCQRETAVLNELDKKYGSLRDFSVLASPYGKNYDTSGQTDTSLVSKSDITWFKNTFNVQHPILVDRDFATYNKYGLVSGPTGAGFPSIYIIDGNGIVRYRSTGEVPYQTLAKAVQAAMKGQTTK